MKIILTGATGFVGAAALDAALVSPDISEVTVLTRRPLKTTNSELREIIHNDFSTYTTEILDEIESADGCIWAIGGKAGDFPSLEIARKVTVEYTIAFAAAIAQRRSSSTVSNIKSSPFRFIYCSGRFSSPDPEKQKHLWLLPDTRRLKGDAEAGLFKVADESGGIIQVVSLRPGGILPVKTGLLGSIMGAFGHVVAVVPVNVLARKFVELVVHGPPSGEKILENEEIMK